MVKKAFTKIVATIGPSTWDDNILKEIIENGMRMARINASFADHDELLRVSQQIRNMSPKVAVMLDSMGHKIRVTGFEEDKTLKKGDKVIILPSETKSPSDKTIQITYPNLHKYARPNSVILIDDGNLKLVVTKVQEKEVHCEVEVGGTLKKGKTVNTPGLHLEFEGLGEKDTKDIRFAVENNFDYVSASFIRDSKDILEIRELMGKTDTKLIAKIECEEAVENFDSILAVVDGIMVARGDLGVELPLEKVPILQKKFIHKCREAGKPVIVATQMLESMRENPRPTRAEISDVANAVTDGADALMLSAETSTGKYPVEAVTIMNRAAIEAESSVRCAPVMGDTWASEDTDYMCKTIDSYVRELGLKGVIVISKTGRSIASLARHRLNVPIWNISTNPKLIRQCNLLRNVEGIYMQDFPDDRDGMVEKAVETVYSHGNLELGDKIAIITGSSIKNKATNSILEIAVIKNILS